MWKRCGEITPAKGYQVQTQYECFGKSRKEKPLSPFLLLDERNVVAYLLSLLSWPRDHQKRVQRAAVKTV